jgi:hypothetical protein
VPLADIRGHSRSGIADAQLKLAVIRHRDDGHYSAGRRVLHRVENQIVQGVANLIDVESCGPDGSWNGRNLQADAFGGGELSTFADDLLFGRHGVLQCRRGGALRHPNRSAPRLGLRFAVGTRTPLSG